MARKLKNAVLLSLAAGLAGAASAEWSLVDGASVHPPYRGQVPAKSDVVFSSRFERKEAPDLIRAFGATRVEWVYTDSKEFVQKLVAAAPWVGGAVATTGKNLPENMLVKGFDGRTLVIPRMARWGGEALSSNDPEAQRLMRTNALRLLDWGASSIHFDNMLMQYFSALYLGGDFNPATVAGFPKFLARYPDQGKLARLGLKGFNGDYRDFVRSKYGVKDAKDYEKRYKKLPSNEVWLDYIRSTVEEDFRALRKAIDERRGKPVPVSMNLSVMYEPSESNRQFFLGGVVDYALAETHIDDLTRMLWQSATARAIGIGFIPSIRPLSLPENRVAIATEYALGNQPLVPWDVYTGNDEEGQGQRYFGMVEEYADLYRLVRSNAGLFDGLESVAVVGIAIPVDHFADKPTRALVQTLIDRQIPFAFVAIGGSTTRYLTDAKRLQKFKAVVTVNPDADFAAADLQQLSAVGVPRLRAAQMTNAMLDDLRPFVVAPGGDKLRLYARAAPGDRARLVVHLVDSAHGALASTDAGCRRRVGVSEKLFDPAKVVSARWVSLAGNAEVMPEPGDRGTYFSIAGCSLWGALEIKLKP